jgi:hypothetical protein
MLLVQLGIYSKLIPNFTRHRMITYTNSGNEFLDTITLIELLYQSGLT